MVKITLHHGDILKLKVDAIVNQESLDNQIHIAAGPSLLEECKLLGGVPIGTAKITHGHNLVAKYIIHTTGPKRDNEKQDFRSLANCYNNVLKLAQEYNIKSLALCSISIGMYGFDKTLSAQVAVNTVKKYLVKHPHIFKEIIFNVNTMEEMDIHRKLFKNEFKPI